MNGTSSSSSSLTGRIKKGLSFMIGIAFFIGFLIGMEMRLGLDGATSLLGPTLLEQQQLQEQERLQQQQQREKEDNNLLPKTYLELLSLVFHQRKDVVEKKLQSEYAHYYGLTFDPSFLHQQLFIGSHERLIRRIMFKIINAQRNQKSHISTHDLKTTGKDSHANNEDDKVIATKTLLSTLTWVTTGDAIAAADGNYFFQSYTHVLEDTVKDAFAAVGIQFVTKNYATSYHVPERTSMEPYICMESLFGADIDFLSWETLPVKEGKQINVDLWSKYANRHPTKPILFLIDDIHIPSSQHFLSLDNKGMPAIFMNQDSFHQLHLRYPDATDITKDPNNLPLPLQYLVCYGMPEGMEDCDDAEQNFRCNVNSENNKCVQNRFSTQQLCPMDDQQKLPNQQRKLISSSQGWKEHLLKGRLLGYYLLDLLEESLLRLDMLETDIDNELFSGQKKHTKNKQDPEILEQMELTLQKQMDRDAFLYQQSTIEEQQKDNPFDVLYPAFCQSSLLLETNQLLPVSLQTPSATAIKGNVNDTIPLAATALKDYGHCERVNSPREGIMIVREGYGWHAITTTIPPEIEKDRKSLVSKYNKGIIMMCFQFCMDSDDESVECFNPSSSMEGLNVIKIVQGNINIAIDDVPVVDAEEMEGCYLLKNEQGAVWWNSQQQEQERTHSIQIRVNEPNSKIQITSFIFL